MFTHKCNIETLFPDLQINQVTVEVNALHINGHLGGGSVNSQGEVGSSERRKKPCRAKEPNQENSPIQLTFGCLV